MGLGRMIASAWVAVVAAGPATAAEHRVEAPADAAVTIAAARPGDTVTLAPGVHTGGLVIDRPLHLVGEPGAIVDAGGIGTVIRITAPGVTVRGLTLTGSGPSLTAVDSGVFLDKTATGAVIAHNRFHDVLFGVYVHGARDSVIRDNDIEGRQLHHVNDRGNGIHIWNAPGTAVVENRVRYGRDGIFVTTSRDNLFRGNVFRDLRFAIHYMYTNQSEVSDNHSINNHVGFALMYSTRLTVAGNRSVGDRDHGLLLNFTNSSAISGNHVHGQPDRRPDPTEKCVFIYNAHKNNIHGNRFEGCAIGIHFTAGSERNRITGNAFIGNVTQVKYVGTRWVEWSADGEGNYWSDNSAFDLDGDGIADVPYQPNDLMDQVLWRHPLAKLLLAGPAARLLRWAQTQFPVLHPGGVVDRAPLMTPPPQARASAS